MGIAFSEQIRLPDGRGGPSWRRARHDFVPSGAGSLWQERFDTFVGLVCNRHRGAFWGSVSQSRLEPMALTRSIHRPACLRTPSDSPRQRTITSEALAPRRERRFPDGARRRLRRQSLYDIHPPYDALRRQLSQTILPNSAKTAHQRFCSVDGLTSTRSPRSSARTADYDFARNVSRRSAVDPRRKPPARPALDCSRTLPTGARPLPTIRSPLALLYRPQSYPDASWPIPNYRCRAPRRRQGSRRVTQRSDGRRKNLVPLLLQRALERCKRDLGDPPTRPAHREIAFAWGLTTRPFHLSSSSVRRLAARMREQPRQ